MIAFYDSKTMFYISIFILMPFGLSWNGTTYRIVAIRCAAVETRSTLFGILYAVINIGKQRRVSALAALRRCTTTTLCRCITLIFLTFLFYVYVMEWRESYDGTA